VIKLTVYEKEDVVKILKNKKIKVTPNRLYIAIKLFNSTDHPSIDELHQNLIKSGKRVSFTSVYNIVKLFKNAGLVQEIMLQNKIRYDANITPHAHFICRKCEKIWDVQIDDDSIFNREDLINFKNIVEEKLSGYKVDSVEVNLIGICKDCSNKNSEA
jgi:Fur family peroxide stress response transcriptional regulator